MQKIEYKVVAAPRAAKKFKGVKTHADRFARTVEETIAEEAVNGWEYFRADTLPSDQKGGLLRKGTESYQTLLIFRRSAPILAAKKASPIADPIPAPKWDSPADETAKAEEDAPKRPSLGAATD
jgi:hypothetical protein